MQTFTRALVTGASGGIGAAIAQQLAGRGTHLVLVARSKDALDQRAAELADAHGVETEVLVADLGGPEGIASVAARLLDVRAPVDLLVNNAGVGSTDPFVDSPAATAIKQVDLNIRALVELTHVILPRLIAEGRGGVLNVSSVAGFQPIPRMAVYAATKAFVSSFSQAVHEEVRNAGVHVTALCPGFTRTDFVANADAEAPASRLPDFLWSEAEPVAIAGVEGVARGRALVVPGGLNQVAAAVSQVTPSTVSRRVLAKALDTLP